jgi:hypothetical protein
MGVKKEPAGPVCGGLSWIDGIDWKRSHDAPLPDRIAIVKGRAMSVERIWGG